MPRPNATATTLPTSFVPSSWHLEQQLAEADRKFAAARERGLRERAESAMAFSRAVTRERRENALVQMPRSTGFKCPI